MFDLCEAVREQIHPIKILDVGAMISGDPSTVAYRRLLDKNIVEVVGFEPIEEECARLNALDPKGPHKYLPYAVGDGTVGTFNQCNHNMTSSLLRPNYKVLERFTDLAEIVQIVKSEPIQTHRLDDIAEARGADYIKLDIQGAELDVIRGAKEILESVVVLETEVEFISLYENQPLFADVDTAMRKAGFQFHRFSSLESQTLRPLRAKESNPFRGQLLWGDAIYVKSFETLHDLTQNQLLKLAVIMDLNYGSRDFTLLALQVAEERGGPKLWDEYSMALTKSVKVRPPAF